MCMLGSERGVEGTRQRCRISACCLGLGKATDTTSRLCAYTQKMPCSVSKSQLLCLRSIHGTKLLFRKKGLDSKIFCDHVMTSYNHSAYERFGLFEIVANIEMFLLIY